MSSVFSALARFLQSLSDYVSFDYLLYGSAGLIALLLIGTLIRTNRSYEVKLLRSVNKLNAYLLKNPYIKEENLIYFNDTMKKVPHTLRYCWQEYMLNRDKVPSDYMSTLACVDQPIKTSSYQNTTRVCAIFTNIIACVALIIGLGSMTGNNGLDTLSGLFNGILIPILLFVFGNLFVAFLNTRRTAIVSDLYFSYHEFERNINKACTTLPEFIDYEVLFSKKEIKQGIPVLQEYLDKMALIEQKKREEEELNKFQYEEYDFEKIGVDNSLLLERAMNESEKYINVKRNLTDRVKAKEQEKYNHQKSFDEVTKEFERKSQACKESLSQLTEQINNTTSKIDANYLRKRATDEQQKLQLLEKDYDMAKGRFDKDQQAFQDEIDKYNADVAKRKATAEEAMIAECRTYVNKVYSKVTETVISQTEPFMKQLEDQKLDLEEKVTDLDNELIGKSQSLSEMQSQLDEMEKQFNIKAAEIEALKSVKEYFTSEEFLKRVSMSKKELVDYVESGKGNRPANDPYEYKGALAYEDLTDVIPADIVRQEETSKESETADEIAKNEQVLRDLLEQKKQLEAENADLENKKKALEDEKHALEANNQQLSQNVDVLNETVNSTMNAIEDQQMKLVTLTQKQKFANIVKPRQKHSGVYKLKVKQTPKKKSDPLKNSLSKLLSTVEKSKSVERPKKKTVTSNAKVNTKKTTK